MEPGLLAQRVEIMTDNGPVMVLLGSIPPHLIEEAQRKKPMEIKNMLIDIGADDQEDAKESGLNQVNQSCRFVHLPQWRMKKKIHGKSMG